MTVENSTAFLKLPLPDIDNPLNVDVYRLQDALEAIDTYALNGTISAGNNTAKLNDEQLNRRITTKNLFNLVLSSAQLKQALESGLAGVKDAIFEVDPKTGQIRNRAFAYTDNAFTEASLVINGVKGEINLTAQKLQTAEGRISSAEGQLLVQAGQISQRATYAEITEQIAGAIDAIQPAYSFGFFNSSEGWTAVNGTLTPAGGRIDLTLGDIQNNGLSYDAVNNPIITVAIERTAGSGWKGDLIVVANGYEQVFTNVITNVALNTPVVRTLNLKGSAQYIGTITSVRFRFGTTTADQFKVSAITIGKPSANQQQLESLSSRVTDLGTSLNALDGKLTSYATTEWVNANTLKISDVRTEINSFNTTYSITATLTQLGNNNTISKANAATTWIDGANATIDNRVSTFLSMTGGVNAQLQDLRGQYTTVNNSIDAVNGTARQQALSISELRLDKKDIGKLQFFAELELLKMRQGLLDTGSSVAVAEQSITSLATAQGAIAQQVLKLEVATGTSLGQLNASLTQTNQAISNESSARASSITSLQTDYNGKFAAQTQLIQQVQTKADGTADSLAALRTAVTTGQGSQSAELVLQTTINKAAQAVARAFLGVTNTSTNGAKRITGITIDGQEYSLEFTAGKLRLLNSAGQPALFWDEVSGVWQFYGRMVLSDGTVINNQADIKGQKGDTGATGPQGPQGPQGPAGANGTNGAAGQHGAGLYTLTLRNGVFPADATATADFVSAYGRNPVKDDHLTYRNASGSASSTKSFNGSSWVAPTLLIHGSLVATDSIAGDRIIAGTSITSPLIKGGEIRLVGTQYMEVMSATPFGPHSLIEWYGQKIDNVNWNPSTLDIIPAGLLKSNAKTYKDATGGVYFGGVFQAGTLSNSGTTTLLSNTASREIEFTSNGGLITVAASFSYAIELYGPTNGNSASVVCPVSPVFSIPSGTLFLENWNGTAWVTLAQWPIVGDRGCTNGEYAGEVGVPNQAYRAWATGVASQTYTDQSRISGYRKMRVRVVFNTAGYNTQSQQSLSIATSE